MTSTASDRTVNKIALCGAIFAGVAYVGYSVVKQAFGKTFPKTRKRPEDEGALLDYDSHKRKIHLRRLSGSGMSALATEILLRNQESRHGERETDEAGHLIFRPLSVQERIRELNLRARQFSETILAVQIQDGYQRPTALGKNGHAISLQPSPSHTPRPLSPINIPQYGSSKCNSTENLSLDNLNGYGSLRRRHSRRSSKKFMKSPDFMSREDLEDCVGKETEKLLDERETELRRRLQGFENGTTKVLTPYEAKSLVALLHSKDCDTLERVLVTLSNSAAFSVNQDHLRDAGCLVRLQHLIVHSDLSVKLAAIRAAGNMALNQENQKEMELFVPLLLLNIRPSKMNSDDSLLVQRTLFSLTNIAALNDWHSQMAAGLPRIISLARSECSNVSIQALRLLINLSTNEEMISHLLMNEIFNCICDMIESNPPEDTFLKILTLFANVIQSAVRLELMPKSKHESSITSRVTSANIVESLSVLMKIHPNDEIRFKAKVIHKELSNL